MSCVSSALPHEYRVCVSHAFQIFSFLGEIQGGKITRSPSNREHSLEIAGLVQEVRTQAKVSQLAQGQIAKN